MAANTELIFNDLAYGRIKTEISATATEIELLPGNVLSFLDGWVSGKEFYLTITNVETDIEIVKVTSISGDTLTVERGQDNSTAQAWKAGALITQRSVAANLERFIQKEGFRQIDYNPNGTLSANYPGEEVYQTTVNDCEKRWFKNTSGTNWRLIAGGTCNWEYYDEDGYVVTPDLKSSGFRDVTPDGLSEILYDVAYNGSDLWVAIGEDGMVYTSLNAETWTSQGDKLSSSVGQCIIWDGSKFVASCEGYGRVYTSTDGVTWTKKRDTGCLYDDLFSIAVDDWGKFVAVGAEYTGCNQYSPLTDIEVTTDLSSYTQRSMGEPSDDTTKGYGIAWGDPYWVLVCLNGEVQTATSGAATWTHRQDYTGMNDIIYVDPLFFIVGTLGAVYYAADPTSTWTSAAVFGAWTLRAIDYGEWANGTPYFVAVGDNGEICVSEDGDDWTRNTAEASALNDFKGVCIGDGKIVIVGYELIKVL